MAGWIKIYRDIVTKDIYLQDPLYARVFERLIIEANHACKRIPYKGETKLIKRGEKLTSIRQIADWVGWYQRGIFKVPNPKTISTILKWMIKNNLIEIHGLGNSQETHYNIVNYCIYQSRDDGQSNSVSNSQVTVDGSVSIQSLDTNKNVNNVKNEKEHKKPSLSSNKFADDAIEYVLACELYNLILLNNPDAKKPDLQSWSKHIDLMIRVDKRSATDIQIIINWCQKDSFWQANILSTKKLREKYDQLTMKMNSNQRADKPKTPNFGADRTLKKDSKYESMYL
jgi:hypothetical protein